MILGIVPGTRSSGFALIREGEIKKWGVKMHRGAWSEGKLIGVLYGINQLITRHRIRIVAIKVPDRLPRSTGYAQLIGALNVLFEQKGIEVRYFTLSDLTKRHAQKGKMTRAALFAFIAHRHPELLPLYRKEQAAKKPYYDRVFEAVAAAQCVGRGK